MNKSLLDTTTGSKDTERRGKYLKKLFDSNVLGPNKSLLNREDLQQMVYQKGNKGINLMSDGSDPNPLNIDIMNHTSPTHNQSTLGVQNTLQQNLASRETARMTIAWQTKTEQSQHGDHVPTFRDVMEVTPGGQQNRIIDPSQRKQMKQIHLTQAQFKQNQDVFDMKNPMTHPQSNVSPNMQTPLSSQNQKKYKMPAHVEYHIKQYSLNNNHQDYLAATVENKNSYSFMPTDSQESQERSNQYLSKVGTTTYYSYQGDSKEILLQTQNKFYPHQQVQTTVTPMTDQQNMSPNESKSNPYYNYMQSQGDDGNKRSPFSDHGQRAILPPTSQIQTGRFNATQQNWNQMMTSSPHVKNSYNNPGIKQHKMRNVFNDLNLSVDFAQRKTSKNVGFFDQGGLPIPGRYNDARQSNASSPENRKVCYKGIEHPVGSGPTPNERREQRLKLRPRIDIYGNLINEDSELLPRIMQQSLKSCESELRQDWMKFVNSKVQDQISNQLSTHQESKNSMETNAMTQSKKKKSLITSSNHYKYNRLRQGGWGIKGPQHDNPMFPRNLRNDFMNGPRHSATNAETANKLQNMDILFAIKNNNDDDSVIIENKDDYKEIDVQLRKVKVFSQDQQRKPKRVDMKHGGTIFPSKDKEELIQETVKKNTMLQDSIHSEGVDEKDAISGSHDVTLNLDTTSFRNRYDDRMSGLGKLYKDIHDKEFSKTGLSYGSNYVQTPGKKGVRESQNYEKQYKKVLMIETNPQIRSKKRDAVMNQYDSTNRGKDDHTVTLTSTARHITNPSNLSNHNEGTQDSVFRYLDGIQILTQQQKFSKLTERQKTGNEFKGKMVHKRRDRNDFRMNRGQTQHFKTNGSTPRGGFHQFQTHRDQINNFQQSMSVDISTRQAGQPGQKIFNTTAASKLSSTGPTVSDNLNSVDRYESGIDSSRLKAEVTFMQRKSPDDIIFELEVERAQKASIFEQFDQSKNNKLFNSYNYQGIQQEKLQNRKQISKLQQLIKEKQQQIKDRKKEIYKQKLTNHESRQMIVDQFNIFQRLNTLETNLNTAHFNTIVTNKNEEDMQEHRGENEIDEQFQKQPSNSPKREDDPNNSLPKRDLHSLYKYLFESDLKTTKDSTLQQLDTINEQRDDNIRECNYLTFENDQLKRFIARYRKMIEEQYNPNGESQNPHAAYKISNSSSDKINIEQIDREMYKFSKGQSDKPKSQRPQIQVVRKGTMMSFGMANKGPAFMEVRKAETMNLLIKPVFKLNKPIDSLVQLLIMIKQTLKALKVTLFVVDPDMQQKIFGSQKDRKHNYQKLNIAASSVHAVYCSSEDFMKPIFNDVEEINQVFNSKYILVPFSESSGKVQLCIQVMHPSANSSDKNAGSKKGKNSKSITSKAAGKLKSSVSPDRQKHSRSPSNNNVHSSSITLNSQQNKWGMVAAQVIGWSHNDLVMLKIMMHYTQMTAHYYTMQVLKSLKKKKAESIIEFSIDMMKVKSYGQIVRKFNGEVGGLLGFESCTIFFKNSMTGDLFTVADQKVVDPSKMKHMEGYIDTTFAREYFFPHDQIVIFPSSMGISGEVHSKKGIYYDNYFGQLVKKNIQEDHDGSEYSLMSPAGADHFDRRFSGLKPQKGNSMYSALSPLRMKQTGFQLEKIEEDNPQAENENITGRLPNSHVGSKKNSTLLENIQQKPMSPQNLGAGNNYLDDSFENIASQTQINKFKIPPSQQNQDTPKHNSMAIDKQTSLCGNILDLVNRREMRNQSTARRTMTSTRRNKWEEELDKYTSAFTPDIDNFQGILGINNYCISSIKDDGYLLGEESVGILQLFNKMGAGKGTRSNIEKEDVARIIWMSRFIGALAVKAQAITNFYTLVIGMRTNMQPKSENPVFTVECQPGLGSFTQMDSHVEILDNYMKDLDKWHKEEYKSMNIEALPPNVVLK